VSSVSDVSVSRAVSLFRAKVSSVCEYSYIYIIGPKNAGAGGKVVAGARSRPVGAVDIKMLWNGPILLLAKKPTIIAHHGWIPPSLIALFHCIYILVEYFTLFVAFTLSGNEYGYE
jgi:hypothetical protein